MLILLLKPLPLIILPSEGPYHADTCQVFLRDRGQNALILIAFLEMRSDFSMEIRGISQDHRNTGCGDQR